MVYFVMFAVICCFSQRKVKSVKNLIRPLKLLEAIKLLTFTKLTMFVLSC